MASTCVNPCTNNNKQHVSNRTNERNAA
jgi:hypothetical protein